MRPILPLMFHQPTIMDNAPQSSTSASLSVDATMQAVKTRDPRLSDTQAEAAAATYFAKVCGTNIEKEYDSLSEVLLRLEDNQRVLANRCDSLKAQVDELERRRKQLTAGCVRS